MSNKQKRAATAAFFCLLTFASQAAFPENIDCEVVGVTDGDTLTCLTEAKARIKVRLAQIDAPEKAQPFGQRSKQALSDLVFGQPVTLERETTDRYGRMVAKVVKGGQDVNLQQVLAGMAWVYDQYAHDPAYFAAQESAKSARSGLWSDPNPVRPSDWRHGGARPDDAAVVAAAAASEPAKTKSAGGGFSCEGKHTCRQMSSCAEARFYLTQCGVRRLDGDHDGTPCESLCR